MLKVEMHLDDLEDLRAFRTFLDNQIKSREESNNGYTEPQVTAAPPPAAKEKEDLHKMDGGNGK